MIELWYDTEGTGFSATKHGLLELGGLIVENNNILEEFLFKMKPTGKTFDQRALDVTGYTIKQIKALTPWEEIYPEVIKLFDKYINKYDKTSKFITAGHNISYDNRMLNGFFKAQGNNYLYSYIDSKQVIDTLPLARKMQKEGIIPRLVNNKLSTLCEYFDVPLENAHSALCDIQATRGVYLKMVQLLLDREKNL